MNSNLPQDCMIEIFVRLRVKSLMRFKCVDPSWNALLTTSTFITCYTNHMQDQRYMIFNDNCRLISLCSDHPLPWMQNRHLKCPLMNCSPCGPYNGIFCLCSGRDKLLLWNPATREVKTIPSSPSMLSHYDHYHYDHYVTIIRGFGGDPDARDLKIVNLVIHNQLVDCCHNLPYAELYNLSTNSWTHISKDAIPIEPINDEDEYLMPRDKDGTLANGVCYWLTNVRCILCFNFRNNQFSKVELPPQTGFEDGVCLLAEIDDSIAYVLYHCDQPLLWEAEFWILEQDNCWIKRYYYHEKSLGFSPLLWKKSDDNSSSEEPVELVSLSPRPSGQSVRHVKVVASPKPNKDYYICKYVESMVQLSFSS